MRKVRQYRGGYQFSGLKELVRELRKKKTSAEVLLWELIRNRQLLGFKFRRQHQFGDYVADFYCHEALLVLEYDGLVHQSNEQWYHDKNRDALMIAQGVRVLRFTNEEILIDTGKVIEKIARYLPSDSEARKGGLVETDSHKALTPTLSQWERERKTEISNGESATNN